MKIIITGSLGHISKPLAVNLVKKGHSVTVISSKEERQKDIEAMGAKAAIGSMENVSFLDNAFTGADIVYCMETLGEDFFFNHSLDYMAAIKSIAHSYKQAIEQSGVKKVIHLSSIGAHTNEGNGMLKFHFAAEEILRQLPDDVFIKTMRPVGFYYNMLAFIQTIKSANSIFQNYGGDEKEPWVSPNDIATVIAEEIELPFTERKIRYIASDELSPNEVAKTIGEEIGKPDLKWITIPDEQFLNNLLSIGFNPNIAKGLTEMNAARRNGLLYEDYFRNRPALSNTKLKDYAKTFAAIYNQ